MSKKMVPTMPVRTTPPTPTNYNVDPCAVPDCPSTAGILYPICVRHYRKLPQYLQHTPGSDRAITWLVKHT